MESVGTCSGTLDDPNLTEGFLSALLQDIWDTSNEDDAGISGTWRDRLSLGYDEIFECTDVDHPLNPTDFLNKFKARYPAVTEALWETGKNCGYDLDTGTPAVVTNLQSPSHTVSVSSTDPTIQFTWTRATDDWSGVSGYSVVVAATAQLPNTTEDVGDFNTWTTSMLAPGTYYFSIRTRDKAGRWSTSYASRGPYIIRAAEPANLEPYLAAGWARPVVPRATNDATVNSAPFPTSLPGNTNSTYWNMRGVNSGESSTSGGFGTHCDVDGPGGWWASWGSIGAGGHFYGANIGPMTVRGGRHVFASRFDDGDAIAETNESDNTFGRQWIWTGYALTANVAVTRSAPPVKDGGWEEVTEGVNWYNCDGFRFSGTGWWNAVWVAAASDEDDYDIRLHFPTSSADTGFAASRGSSSRSAGYLDAVLVNRNVLGSLAWDAGVVNYSAGAGDFTIKQVTSSGLSFGDSVNVTIAAGENIVLREFYMDTPNFGPVSITARIVSGTGPVTVQWRGRTFTTGGLSDVDGSAVTPDAVTTARIDVTINETGWNGIALYRDPRDGSAAVTVVLEIETTPPDYHPLWAAGWHAPMVPRPAYDGTAGAVPLPDTLHGNMAATWLNFATRNDGPTGATNVFLHSYIDGQPGPAFYWPTFGGYLTSLFNWSAAQVIPGGRHTLAMVLDKDNAIEEMYEDNNVYGEQYVWSPYPLVANSPLARVMPAARIGGWGQIGSGETPWYNVDGLRMPSSIGWWGAVWAMPGSSSDVDLRLHTLAPGAKDGFATTVAASGWGTGLLDYVLANFNVTPFSAMDVGVMQWSGTQAYTAEAVGAVTHGSAHGLYGPYSLTANHALALHEFYFTAGQYDVRLTNLSGSVDWGLSVHPADLAYQAKSNVVASDWFAGPGQDERFVVTIPSTGWYCVTAWKRAAADLPLSGQFRLDIFPITTGVDPTLPAATAFGSVRPNPFAPQTTVSFGLAREGTVLLEVYDVRGALVRTLIRGTWPAGRHEQVWDGRDDHGHAVAAGVYLVNFSAGGVSTTRKVVRLR
jgi:hypothetical protein